jgi:hypothetical protein
MELTKHFEGFFQLGPVSQVLSLDDVVELVREEFMLDVRGYSMSQVTEVGDDLYTHWYFTAPTFDQPAYLAFCRGEVEDN